MTGISIANDGTMVVRTDTNGAYLWTGSQWQQLVTASSMPAAFDFSGDGCLRDPGGAEQFKHHVHDV